MTSTPEQGHLSQGGDESEAAIDHPADRRSADIGIVCTHSGELKPLLKRLDRVRKYTDRGCVFRGGFLNEVIRVAVVSAGPGFARHRMATETLLAEHNPAWVLSAGYSSALTDGIRSGDICLATEIQDEHGNSLAVRCTIPPSGRIHAGRHLVADRHPQSGVIKRQLAGTSGALACDTTSLAVAQVCSSREVRFLSIRAVIDEADEDVQNDVASLVFDGGSRAAGKALGAVFQGLHRLTELKNWRQRAATASDHLDRFTTGIIEQVAERLRHQRL